MLSRQYRQLRVAEILLRDFGLRAVPHFDPHNQILLCFKADDPIPDLEAMARGERVQPWPEAIVSGPGKRTFPDEPGYKPWGVLAPSSLQGQILEALDGKA